jgi:hypothetical protein
VITSDTGVEAAEAEAGGAEAEVAVVVEVEGAGHCTGKLRRSAASVGSIEAKKAKAMG